MEVLTTDITYLPFGHSMLYLSSIMDIYNGEIVAYKIDDKQDQRLVNDTLNQIDIPEGCILHSNQGCLYILCLLSIMRRKGIIRSMSRKGTPADNAPIESFHSSLKSETFTSIITNNSNHIVIDIVEKYIKTIIIIEFNKTRLLIPCKIQRISALEHSVFIKFPF